MTEVAVLQVYEPETSMFRATWLIVGVFATKALAEQEAFLRGYTRWSVSEFAVMGGDNA